mmetsp:Transcript_118291/g.381830  ORF Transcript_118291/g.381830 Transcript_118291/m.381830 type:complete len:231 (-) Transcript_118291:180-872(-)
MEATSTRACRHSESSSCMFACAACSSTWFITVAVASRGAQSFLSTAPTISQTRSRAAHRIFTSWLAKAFCSTAPSCCCAPTTSSCSVLTRSLSSRRAHSHLVVLVALEASASLKAMGSSAGQPRWPGASQPRWSLASQVASASLATTSPTFLCSFESASFSKSCRSPLATSCLFCGAILAKAKSFSGPWATSCRASTAPCFRTAMSTDWLATTARRPITRLSGSAALACW